MKEPNELDKASLKHDFRKMYNDIGTAGMMQVVYELLLSANLAMEVVNEERVNNAK